MTTNSPNIAISPQNVKNHCDLKCSYDFKYPESNSTATNNGEQISLTYENTSNPSVLYNKQKYTVTGMYICCPSIHYFNDSTQAVGEIIVNHAPVAGGNNLSVGIPFIESTEVNSATSYITEIIEKVASGAPADGDSVNLNLTDFSLQSIIPKKPFYTYTSTSDSTQWIVYGLVNAIPLSNTTLTTLGQLIKPYNQATTGGELFYNSKGPNMTGVGDGIYISCQPTGSSEDETEVTYTKNTTTYDLLDNPTVLLIIQIIIGCILFVIVFLILNYGYHFLISDNLKHLTSNLPKKPA
jgi:carbonic anhydrase